MEILSCSDVQYVGESNCPQRGTGTNFMCNGEPIEHGKQVQVSDVTHKVDDFVVNEEWPKKDRPGEDQGRVDDLPTSEGICPGTSYPEHKEEGQEAPCSLNAEKQNTERCMASDIPLNVEKIEAKLPSSNGDGESHSPESKWLEQEETVALWVKWRGKWQAGIRCARADCPLSTMKARPTHDRKKYFVVFFPQTRNYSWADMLLVRPIHEFPEPIAHRTHSRGVAKVKDLSLPRRYIIQKLAISMVNVSDQLHNEAVIESAREVTAWKEFALEASRCKGYSDLGRMLLKLQTMILQQFIDPNWLQNSFDSWAERCHSAQSAESVETLKEELVNSVLWNEVEALWDAPMQPELGSEWKTWKQEVMKWFSLSHPIAGDRGIEQPHGDSSTSVDHQISRKRPKLEVRRAEMHASQVEASTSHDCHQTNVVEIDSGFFNSRVVGNGSTSVSDPCSDRTVTERSAPSEDPGTVPDRWDKIIVEVENPGMVRTTGVEEAPADGRNYMKPLDPGNKYRQCMAFIEAKGRQCVRWANEDSVYCCVHLATRSLGKTANTEQTPPINAPMCEGTTTHGTKCKHRSRFGSPFCKKHGLQDNQCLMIMDKPSNSPGNTLKRKIMEMIPSAETECCKQIILFGEVQQPVHENSLFITEDETLDGRNNLTEKSESLHCIGLYLENNSAPCPDRAKLHTLYCEKHLPSWLKRARNGKSRIISKEIFADLLRACSSQKQKLHLHQACELLYGFVKSILHRRNPVSKETQLQWILSEASKDLCVGECLMKLISREREKLNRFWSFDVDKDKPISSSCVEQSVLVPVVQHSNNNTQNTIKCKICTEEFPDDQVLGTHWMDIHKKEAQWLFRGYACAICMNSFTNKKVLETHVGERHEMQSLGQCILFQCIPCGTHFMSPQQLWSHVLTVHSNDFKLSTIDQQHNISASQTSQHLELSNSGNLGSEGAERRFSCRFCGLKFDLLPDLGRHHQAAHMALDSTSNISSKRGTHLNPNKLKSGRLSLTKGLGAASYRIRNRGNLRIKKRFQASSSVSTVGLRVQTQVDEEVGLCRLVESQCSSVAKILFSEIQKTKPRPSNLDILSVARSTCCKKSLQDALEGKFGVLPERLYLKAAKLCSELNIQVEWHQEGFICPKGCKSDTDPSNSSPLVPLPSGFMELKLAKMADPMNCEEWEMDECHCIIESRHIKLKPMPILLFEDVSFGRESVPVTCVVDENLLGSINSTIDERSNGKITSCPLPWEGFTYVTERLLDPSLGLDNKSSQLGCACPHSTCSAEACDHVYLFDNDYEDAEDIDGQPMHGRFPYDEKGRIVLKESYLVYECNSMCSCDITCRNRVLQNGVKVKLEVFKTENKGWAVRAGEAIARGTFVCEYIGEVLNDQEANKRAERYGNEGCSYLYHIHAHNDGMSELIEGAVSYVIDARRYGNVSRFINHSCSPNLVIYQVLVDSMDCQLAHIGLYASRDIAEGEELAYDYRQELLPEGGHPCYCGAPNCRGRLY
ncbi:SET domain [Macleaya cordata]|uniref:SET domain n=1 Tax=Macleaya cordata TaxID=56857 RepID=A0A200R7B2_MACCD|nr:SET domain [Macleaya cordata]